MLRIERAFQEALAAAERAVLDEPSRARSHVRRAEALTCLGEHLRAARAIETAIEHSTDRGSGLKQHLRHSITRVRTDRFYNTLAASPRAHYPSSSTPARRLTPPQHPSTRAADVGNLLTTERLFWHRGAHTAEPKHRPHGADSADSLLPKSAVFCGTWVMS